MCGIFGIVTREQGTLGLTLIEDGRWLSYRGYDTFGCAALVVQLEVMILIFPVI